MKRALSVVFYLTVHNNLVNCCQTHQMTLLVILCCICSLQNEECEGYNYTGKKPWSFVSRLASRWNSWMMMMMIKVSVAVCFTQLKSFICALQLLLFSVMGKSQLAFKSQFALFWWFDLWCKNLIRNIAIWFEIC